jgi:hypothetical protein
MIAPFCTVSAGPRTAPSPNTIIIWAKTSPTHLFRNPRHRLPLVHSTRVPLAPQRVLEPRLVLLHTGVWVRQVFDLELARLLVLLLRDDDVGKLGVFTIRREQSRGRLEELGIRLALLCSFTGP